MHRVKGYRGGELERRYESLGIAEEVFVNYGFVTRSLQALHPRPDVRVPAAGGRPWPAAERRKAQLLMDFVVDRAAIRPHEDGHFLARHDEEL